MIFHYKSVFNIYKTPFQRNYYWNEWNLSKKNKDISFIPDYTKNERYFCESDMMGHVFQRNKYIDMQAYILLIHSVQLKVIIKENRLYIEWNLLEKSVKRPFCCTVSILQVYFTHLCYYNLLSPGTSFYRKVFLKII